MPKRRKSAPPEVSAVSNESDDVAEERNDDVAETAQTEETNTDTAPAEEESKVTKKRRRSESDGTTTTTTSSTEQKPRRANAPFKRVGDVSALIPLLPAAMADNSYSVERSGAYGKIANDKLSTVRGRGFRHEKTKKKRGTYRGGTLDTSVRSVKFDD